MTEDDKRTDKDWKVEAEEALERAGESLRAAWEASRETRLGGLERARQAARQFGEAIDRGVAAARERWAAEHAKAQTSTTAEEE
ncbi:MAG: hypothetical protein ACRDU9_10225 [Acidimicrobiia bacterium]